MEYNVTKCVCCSGENDVKCTHVQVSVVSTALHKNMFMFSLEYSAYRNQIFLGTFRNEHVPISDLYTIRNLLIPKAHRYKRT